MHCIFGQVESRANVCMVIEGPRTIRLGQETRYALVVKNVGTGIAKDVMIRVKIPAGMKCKDRSDGFVLPWNLGSLAGKERKVVYCHLNATKVGSFENIGIVCANGKVSKGRGKNKISHPANPNDIKVLEWNTIEDRFQRPHEA